MSNKIYMVCKSPYVFKCSSTGNWYVILTFGFVLQDGWSYKILQTLYPAPMEIQIPPDGPYFVYNSISTDWDRGDHLQQQENIEYFNSVYSSLSWIT